MRLFHELFSVSYFLISKEYFVQYFFYHWWKRWQLKRFLRRMWINCMRIEWVVSRVVLVLAKSDWFFRNFLQFNGQWQLDLVLNIHKADRFWLWLWWGKRSKDIITQRARIWTYPGQLRFFSQLHFYVMIDVDGRCQIKGVSSWWFERNLFTPVLHPIDLQQSYSYGINIILDLSPIYLILIYYI